MATTILQAGPNTPIATPADVAEVAADLRYRIAEAVLTARLPTGVTLSDEGLDIECNLLFDASVSKWIVSPTDVEKWIFQWDADGTNGAESVDYSASYALMQNGSAVQPSAVTLDIAYALADRTVNLITAQSGETASIDIELPAAVTVDGVRHCRDFILDVDNYANADDLALEFTGLDVYYAFVPLEDDSISEMMTIGAGERVRLYFTETPYTTNGSLPVINVARVTLGDFVTSTTPTTQGGN
jgi:hypothetical protein